jgi:Bacterial protein of unknown function (DUF899)
VAGTLILIASLAFHGDLPTHVSVSAALRFIADHDYWLLMHVGTVVAPLVWLGAIAALAGTAVGGRARAVGRLLLPIGVVGATFSVFTFSIDGYVFKILADAWAVASGTEQRELLAMTTTLLKLLTGPFRIEILVWYGLTIMLAGIVVCLDPRYPTWLGLIGVGAGGGALVAGLASLAGSRPSVGGPGLPLDRLVFLLTLPVEGLWMLLLGAFMWRRVGRVPIQPPRDGSQEPIGSAHRGDAGVPETAARKLSWPVAGHQLLRDVVRPVPRGDAAGVVHLANHDVTLCAVSRAPHAKLQAYKRRMRWSFPLGVVVWERLQLRLPGGVHLRAAVPARRVPRPECD